MEEQPKSSSKNSLTYGLITGVVMIVYSLILYLLNLHLNKYLGYVSFLFLVAGMVYGTLQYKKTLGGFIAYGKAFSSGFMIGLYAGIVAAIYGFLFYQFIAPNVIQELLSMSRENIMASSPQLTDDQLEQAMNMTSKFMTPPIMAVFSLIYFAIASLVISLIAAIFLKKEDNSVQAPI
jgi:hypothetical protein